jgi:hypothetical protein
VLGDSVLPKARARRLLDTLWALESAEDIIAAVLALCRRLGSHKGHGRTAT